MVLGKTITKNNIIVPTHTVVHKFMYEMTITKAKQIPHSVWNRNQSRKVL